MSYQVTWLNNTNYAGAGISYGGSFLAAGSAKSATKSLLGPPPTNATAPRLRTSNADGGYFGETRIGPWVEGCNFTGLSDDCVNPYLELFIVTNLCRCSRPVPCNWPPMPTALRRSRCCRIRHRWAISVLFHELGPAASFSTAPSSPP